MSRRHREPPWGRAAVSVTEIEIFDLDAMELSELDAQGREPADRPWIPTVQELEEELAKARYRSRYGKVLKIDGTSMTQTLQDGDIVVALSNSSFKTGDVIAFYYNNRILIKRVIASAGDWVDIDGDGNVYVNGESLEEPYIAEKALGKCDIELPYQVPDGKCFVMGDHRATSVDSRSSAVGCISDSGVVGRIVFRIWPLDGLGLIN